MYVEDCLAVCKALIYTVLSNTILAQIDFNLLKPVKLVPRSNTAVNFCINRSQ